MDLPRVRGACCLDGVDPELVSDVFQPLQGFFIGLVVASHAFLGFVSSDRTKKKLTRSMLRHAAAVSCPFKVQQEKERQGGGTLMCPPDSHSHLIRPLEEQRWCKLRRRYLFSCTDPFQLF